LGHPVELPTGVDSC